MLKALFTWLGLSLCTLGYLITPNNPALAQVTSDNTVNTQVSDDGETAEITGGERAGDNLFHSFQDFSVETGDQASFLNANDIANIFSRVTGGNVSNIDGLISANGSANLFLINPAGIVFGENARLDVGGSFYGSTADSILFEDGEFSATDLNNPPVLTINAPIGLNLRDQPADIVNRSEVLNDGKDGFDFIGLEVNPGNNLAFVGGNVNFEAGEATASGGNIELGGLSTAGTVGINPDGSLSFPESVARADVNLNGADIDVTGTDGGNITVNARNLNLAEEESFESVLQAGRTADSTSPEVQAGDITINATELVALNSSRISNNVEAEALGNSGDIKITTPNLSLTNLSSIDTDTFGQGNAGSIDISATESITLDNSISGISSGVEPGAKGNGGELNITTPNLSLINDSGISASTLGQGDAGLININATESITLDKFSSISSRASSRLFDAEAEGNGGNIQISTGDFSISNDAGVNANTSGIGNGGEINIIANNLSLTNGGDISASTFGYDAENIAQGDGGNITIDVANTLSINSTTTFYYDTIAGIFASNEGDSNGNAGNIDITASKLSLINGSQINSFTRGRGNAGNTTINAQDSIFLSGEDSEGFPSGIFNDVDEAAIGNGGTIDITTKNLGIFDGAGITVLSKGQGDAGLIDISANILSLDNGTITAQAFNNVNGGNLEIDADVIAAFPNGNSDIQASAEQGEGGNITIDAESLFGIEERPLNDSTNDINASSEFALDGSVNVNVSNINPVQGATELPSNVVEPEQTTAQTCQAGRGTANNGLAIAGKGGVTPAPDAPLNSENIISAEQNPAAYAIPEPIETSQGKIQPARGITVTKSGHIVLTAYPTNNAGERIPNLPNCNQPLK
jgi:filamentous hemagglutinin family protein